MNLGKYQLIKRLATGGMAEVFWAKASGPMGFEKNLVIKRILPHLAQDPRFVEMFLSEAKLAAQLSHPNVVHIFDFGEFEGTYYLAMEYIDGPNLRTLSRRAREAGVRLPPAYCAKIIAQACEGLAFAHDFSSLETGDPLHLIHRDVSPDNILLSRQGAVKVVDFGIAKAANQEHRTQTGLVKGKIAYMPPEQIRGQVLDRRVDVYALGVVLYEMFTGAKPFNATTDLSMMQAIVSEPMVPATSRRPDLPRALSQILERALKKEREQRYPDCRTFQMELERFIVSTGESVGAWQLSQFVLSILGNAPSPAPDPSSSTGSVSLPETGSSLARAATVIRSRSNEEAAQASAVLLSTPKSRAGVRVALAGLLLLLTGSGVMFWSTYVSKRAVDLKEPVAIGTTRDVESLQGHAASMLSPQVVAQEPAPVPEPHASAELRPAEPSAIEKPEVRPKSSSAKLALRVRNTRKVAQPDLSSGEVQPAPSLEVAQPSPSPVSRALKKAMLEFRIRPYATVVLDGKQIGHTPLMPTEVEEGVHTVRLINHALRKDVTRTIEVRAGEAHVFKHNLLEE
jgi:serine/threonine protein kinase